MSNSTRVLLFVAAIGISISNLASASSLSTGVQNQATAVTQNPLTHSSVTSSKDAFETIRLNVNNGNGWDDLLSQIDLVVRQHSADPGSRIQALELLAKVLPDAPFSYRTRDGKSWSDFCAEYSRYLLSQPSTNGTNQTEPAFQLVSALKDLAKFLEKSDRKGSAKLWCDVGAIARRLHANAAYPREAIPGLAPMLMSEAHGLAILNEGEKAHESIQLALEWGLVDFEDIYEDSTLAACSTGDSIRSMVSIRQQQYSDQVRNGVVSALGQFRPFAFDFSLPSVDAGRKTKTHYSDKLTVVDIWATWCNPCRASIPHLIRLQDQFGDQGVRVVGIAMEQEKTVEEIQAKLAKFSQEQGINYDLLVGTDSVLEQIPGEHSLPTMVFLDSSGRVRFATSGYRDYTQLRTIVETLLKTPSAESR